MKRVLIVVCATMLTGCMTYAPPTQEPPARVVVIEKPYDATWELVIDWFAATGVSIDKIQKESGLINAAPNSVGIGPLLTCGNLSGGHYEGFSSSMSTVVRKISDARTKVTVNVSSSAHAVRRNGYGMVMQDIEARCISTGQLEKALQDYVVQQK